MYIYILFKIYIYIYKIYKYNIMDRLLANIINSNTNNNINNNINNTGFNFQINEDGENSHDRSVNELAKLYFKKIRTDFETESGYLKGFEDVVDSLNNEFSFEEINYNKKNIIIFYINYVIKKKEFIMNFDCAEDEFFLLCWNRAYTIRNKENEKNIKKSIFDNIMDCFEKETIFEILGYELKTKYKLLCTMGRVNRILASFAFLDYDNELGLFISLEMLKHDFLGKASVLYSEGLDKKEYIEIIDEMILYEYEKKYNNLLNKFKIELIDSLIFNSSSLEEID